MFFGLFKGGYCPIGVDLGPDSVKIAQFSVGSVGANLVAAGQGALSQEFAPYSGQWQRIAIEKIKAISSSVPFKNRKVVTSVHRNAVFVKEIKIHIDNKQNVENVIMEETRKVIPFDPKGALIKHVNLGDSTNAEKAGDIKVLVMAVEKSKVERHLAIFEKSALDVKAVIVWPTILVNCYTSFFGRRRADLDVNVMLLNAGSDFCNVVICRHNKILFARTIHKGFNCIDSELGREKFISEIESCLRYFQSSRGSAVVERVVLLDNENSDENIRQCVLALAKRHSLPAHVGDVLAAVAKNDIYKKGIDPRGSNVDWTNAFGLSLAGNNL